MGNSLFHIVEDISKASGGIRTIVKAIYHQFPTSEIITTCSESTDEYLTFPGSGPWLYNKELKKFLQAKKDAHFHIHGVWMYAQFAATQMAVRNSQPFIVSPHGMFEPHLWRKGTMKKKTYFELLTRKKFEKAHVLHAITPHEQQTLSKLFPKNKTACIPNAINIAPLPERNSSARPYLLFLGRHHQIKGLEILLQAFIALAPSNFDLKIAGVATDYSIKQQTTYQLENHDNIQFIGPVYGEQKNQLYRDAHAFIAPSYSEVVGMVNLEAAIMQTPVITTHQTGLLPAWHHNGGVLINPSIDELKATLSSILQWTEKDRNDRGSSLRQFVIDNYSWKVVKPMWEQVYQSL
jgi:glycosyltransferase involved in cell wall biosynthesis